MPFFYTIIPENRTKYFNNAIKRKKYFCPTFRAKNLSVRWKEYAESPNEDNDSELLIQMKTNGDSPVNMTTTSNGAQARKM